MSRNTSQTFSPMTDLQAPMDVPYHRRDTSTKPKAMPVKPPFTTDPLPQAREKRQPAQPLKKRKRAEPTTPLLSFDPRRSAIPSGRQDPPLAPTTYSGPPTSEYSTRSFDEPQTAPFSDHEPRDPSYELQHGCDAHKRPRIFAQCPPIGQPLSSYPATPSTDINDMNSGPAEFYDSPVSHTSSSSPAQSDQSHTYPPDFPVGDYPRQVQAPSQMYLNNNAAYVQPTVVHQDSYGYVMDPCEDRPGQGYPVQYPDSTYANARLPPHQIPAYPENGSYLCPTRRC
ncbi:hypothetical protein BU15DRAFT_68977 [Melanogaster broomeanus]|nr:hypothetical protein BU15DRAFT_68977 [Melanogaster broomeanus]